MIPRGLPEKYVRGPKIPLRSIAINLYLDKNTKTSSNNEAKLGQRTNIQTGKKPTVIDVSKI